MKNKNEIRDAVRERYARYATEETQSSCCSPSANSKCCDSQDYFDLQSLKIGYSDEELAQVPEGSNLGLGCGNPQAIANLKEGEVVVDLGSGAGFDVFLAAKKVGKKEK